MSTTIESLELEILSSSQSAESGLDKLTASLEKLKIATKGGLGLTAVARQLRDVNSAANGISPNAVSNVTGLAKAVQLLSGTKISSTIATQIVAMSTALNGADFTGSKEKLVGLVDALSPLSHLSKTNLASYVNNLKKLPEALRALDDSTISALTDKIQKLAVAFKPLGDEMQKVANGFSAFPAKIQKLITNTNNLAASNNKVSTSYINLWAKLSMATSAIKRIASKIASVITNVNDYIENVNLFTVSMGKYADEAKVYAEEVSEAFGIDPGEWMRYQGVFMTLASGFGVASDKAYIMSKNLTQLTYDMSSFFNMSYEDAAQKLQSAISGELEPVRRVGYDLSQAALKGIAMDADNYTSSMENLADAMSDVAIEQFAIANGMGKSFNEMTQAEKSQLRYIALMKQVTVVQGDMRRTLDAPANQLRIFKSQVTQAARAIGSIFIPALNAILPYAIAVARVIRDLASAIAGLFGFKMPDVEYSDIDNVTSGAENASGALDDATESAKKLKSYMLGFDELNVINPNEGQDDELAEMLGQLDFKLPTYDFVGEATESRVSQIVDDMKKWLGLTGEINSWADFFDTKLGKILITVGAIGAGIAAWKVAKATQNAITAISKLKSKKINLSFGVVGITTFMADLNKLKDFIDDFSKNGASFSNVSGMLSEFAGLVGDALILLGNVKTAAAFKAIQGIGEIISAISDMSKEGINFENITDAIRGMTTLGIAVGLFTGKLQITGVAMVIQGFTDVIHELAENWDAIKRGDWSGVDKVTLAIGAIEILGGVATAIIGFKQIKGISTIKKASDTITDVTDVTETVSTSTGKLSTKLTSLAKNLGMGVVIVGEITAAAALFVGAVWLLGVELEKVGEAWKPVLENGGDIATAIGIGTGVLVTIGSATFGLGKLKTTLLVNIALGTAILAEVSAATDLYIIEIWAIGKLLDAVGDAWKPVLDNGNDIAEAIGLGTGILLTMAVATAAIGALTTTTGGVTIPAAIGIGTAVLVEVSIATDLFIAEVWAIGELLDEVRKAWKPVLDDGDTVEKAIDEGTGYLVSIALVTAALGALTFLTGGGLAAAILIGVGVMFAAGLAFDEFADNVSDVARHLNTLNTYLPNANQVSPKVESGLDKFAGHLVDLAGLIVLYTGGSALAGLGATIDAFIKFFTKDPIKHLADEIDHQYDDLNDLYTYLQGANAIFDDVIEMMRDFNTYLAELDELSGNKNGSNKIDRKLNIEVGVSLVKKGWAALSTFVGNKVDVAISIFKQGWLSISSFVGTSVSTGVSLVKQGWSSITNFVGNSVSVAVSLVKSGWNNIKDWIGDLSTTFKMKLPHLTIEWKDTGILGIKYPKFSVEYYKNGGFPDMGQMFVAREAGAELVGNIGSRTAVMNNDQIVESVSTGVYQAVVAALGSGDNEGGEIRIVINLDGEKIYENQQKVARNRGYDLGMGVFSFG